MSLTPSYGETPLPDDELEALLPSVRATLGEPVTKADVYELEQVVQVELSEELVPAVAGGELTPEELLTRRRSCTGGPAPTTGVRASWALLHTPRW